MYRGLYTSVFVNFYLDIEEGEKVYHTRILYL